MMAVLFGFHVKYYEFMMILRVTEQVDNEDTEDNRVGGGWSNIEAINLSPCAANFLDRNCQCSKEGGKVMENPFQ